MDLSGKIMPQSIASTASAVASRLPEQITDRLRIDQPGSQRVYHETIYQYVYSPEGRRQGLYQQMPRKPRGLSISHANTIAKRPAEIAERSNFGHWEGDLVALRNDYGKANLTTLVERGSVRWGGCRPPRRHSQGVITGITQALAPLPPALRQSITFDRGTEFGTFPVLRTQLGIESNFCWPSAPWQKVSLRTATAASDGSCRSMRTSRHPHSVFFRRSLNA